MIRETQCGSPTGSTQSGPDGARPSRAAAHDDSDVSIWESLPDDRETPSDRSLNQGEVSGPLLRTLPWKR